MIIQYIKKIKIWTILLLTLLGLLSGYIAFEIKVRYELRNHYKNNATPIFFRNEPLSFSSKQNIMEDYFGWRKTKYVDKNGIFKINTSIDTAFVDTNSQIVFYASASTNNLGFLSDKTYTIKRNTDNPEYRIVIVGDSMTGGTTANKHWVDLVEDILNEPSVHSQIGIKEKIKLYNLGVPGAGFKQFWEFYDTKGRQFDPDAVIVNYIESDFPRSNRTAAIGQINDESLMIEEASKYINKFKNLEINFLVTLMPLYQDMYPNLANYHLTKELKKKSELSNLILMRDVLPWSEWSDEELKTWYNLPWDGHMSLRGGTIYAREMAKIIAKNFFNVNLKFESKLQVEIERFNLYLKNQELYGKNKIFIGGRYFKIQDMIALRNKITEEYIKGKELSWKPYGLMKLMGKDILYSSVPPETLLVPGFHKLDLESNPKQTGFLQLTCLKSEEDKISLSNPGCFHSYTIYVGNFDDPINKLSYEMRN